MTVYKRNLYVLCLTIFLAAVSWNQIIPFLPLFLKDLGVSHSLAQWSGLVFALQSLSAIVMQPFWGRLGDRVGRKAMIIRAGICLAAIYFGMSVCRTAWQLALLRLANGALTGFIPSSLALIATNTPEEQSGRYVATAQAAQAFGGVTGPVLGSVLAAVLGRRGSMRLSFMAVAVATLLAALLVKEENRPVPEETKTGLIGDFRRMTSIPSMPMALVVSLLAASVNAAIQPILAFHLEALASQRPAWLDGAVYALPGLAFAGLAYPWTRAGEKLTRQKVMGFALAGAALWLVSLAFIRSVWLFAAGYFMVGVFLAALSPNIAAMVAEEVPVDWRGGAYGIVLAASTTGAFLAPLAGGIIGTAMGLPSVFAALAIFTGGGACLVLGHRKRVVLTQTVLETGADKE